MLVGWQQCAIDWSMLASAKRLSPLGNRSVKIRVLFSQCKENSYYLRIRIKKIGMYRVYQINLDNFSKTVSPNPNLIQEFLYTFWKQLTKSFNMRYKTCLWDNWF